VRADGVRRKLVGVEVDGDPLSFEISQFWPACSGGRQVGHVTDLVWSPRLTRNIGYVWVPIELAGPGTQLRIETPDGTAAGRTAPLPFLDPAKKIPAS
jgi:glycine cleavage system aminomethyltransferase T